MMQSKTYLLAVKGINDSLATLTVHKAHLDGDSGPGGDDFARIHCTTDVQHDDLNIGSGGADDEVLAHNDVLLALSGAANVVAVDGRLAGS